MIKISKITTQTKNTERFNIFIDKGNGEEYGFSVDLDVFIEFQIRKGNEYTEEQLNEILYKDDIKKAFNLALKYLSYRMRAEKEIRDYLHKKDFSEDIAGIVIERLKKHKYVNDLEFAQAFVRSRILNSTKGPLLIRQELQQKGISEANIQESLKEFPEETQLDIAFQFAEKNAKQNKTMSDYQVKQKIGQALLSKGFSQPIVKTALSEIVIEKDEEQKFHAIFKQGEKAYKRYSSKFEGWELDQKVKQYLYQRGFKSDEIDTFLTRYKEDFQ